MARAQNGIDAARTRPEPSTGTRMSRPLLVHKHLAALLLLPKMVGLTIGKDLRRVRQNASCCTQSPQVIRCTTI
jgi:hypothetical protein